MIITSKNFEFILKHRDSSSVTCEVDLGLRQVSVEFLGDFALLDGAFKIPLTEKLKSNFCYLLNEKGIFPLAFFAVETNCFYKLIPTRDWPSLAIGSVPMHALTSPKQDTYNKLALINPYGCVLDTCMGLGYTAILSAQRAAKVLTFEKDENVYLLASHNPHSAGLFEAGNIEIRKLGVDEGIKKLESRSFDCIIHDPPTFKLAPELYHKSFYLELRRVLKDSGRLFHYTPLYKITQGYDFPSKIKENLIKTGFSISTFEPEKGGVVCRKAAHSS